VTLGRLHELARPTPATVAPAEERCELCAEPIGPEHRHMLDLHDRRLLCACRACSILFDRRAAGGGHFRLLPERALAVADFQLDDLLWQRLNVPVDLAFFFHSSAADRVVAFYPGALGPVESQLELDAWTELASQNPILREVEPDVEALLVNRTRGAAEHWLVPVDRCYALVGVIRTHWRGLAGGDRVWVEVGDFFDSLRRGAKTVTRDGKETTWTESRSASHT
jgi:hypothetical protein